MKSKFMAENVSAYDTADDTDPVLFEIPAKGQYFTIGVTDMLHCLKFAEDEGYVPKLPENWWADTAQKYDVPKE